MTARSSFFVAERLYGSYQAYLADHGGALARAADLGPDGVVAEVARAGLRGRGGAGFPTGVKWRSVKDHPCPRRFAVMNAAEGEPATFKDRWLLRANPYAALEGLAIAARVVGAEAAFIAIKASFEREIARLRAALGEMAPALGDLRITIVEGPEEYLFGEEKALLATIEGDGPLPRPLESPPYELGLYATPGSPNPALVNNVETLARVPEILRSGADAFRRLGSDDTPGPILVTLCGAVAQPGIYEVEAGRPFAEILAREGGGPRPGRAFKAALPGVSAAPLPADRFGTPVDFGSLALAGSALGAGGFWVLDDGDSAPRVAQAVARFLYVESCNQCSACKVGLRTASASLDALAAGALDAGAAIERMVVAAQHAPQGRRCFLPVEASLVLPSLARRFRADFEGAASAPPVQLPKIVDFDPARGGFVYDEAQARKRPDWTWEPPAPPHPPARPAPRPSGPVTVRLDEDVARGLAALATSEDDFERAANAALRTWLGLGGRRL